MNIIPDSNLCSPEHYFHRSGKTKAWAPKFNSFNFHRHKVTRVSVLENGYRKSIGASPQTQTNHKSEAEKRKTLMLLRSSDIKSISKRTLHDMINHDV